MRVAARAVDHGTAKPALVGDPRQDVAPDGRILAAAVVEHHDVTGRDIVYVIAHGAGRLARWPVENGERAAGQAHAVIERFDAEALAGDAEAIHGVAEARWCRGATPARRRYLLWTYPLL